MLEKEIKKIIEKYGSEFSVSNNILYKSGMLFNFNGYKSVIINDEIVAMVLRDDTAVAVDFINDEILFFDEDEE